MVLLFFSKCWGFGAGIQNRKWRNLHVEETTKKSVPEAAVIALKPEKLRINFRKNA
jgi:hypothetical protein